MGVFTLAQWRRDLADLCSNFYRLNACYYAHAVHAFIVLPSFATVLFCPNEIFNERQSPRKRPLSHTTPDYYKSTWPNFPSPATKKKVNNT